MAKLFVIQRGKTIWQDEGRFEAAAGVPLSAEGAAAVKKAAKVLATEKISVVYAGSTEAERQTAELAAGVLAAKVKANADLSEYDYGLWQGLTTAEVRKRQPHIYRQWKADPASVHPPGAETLADARRRLCRGLLEILKRRGKGKRLVVLGPVAMGLLRCVLDGAKSEELWKNVDDGPTYASYEVTAEMLRDGKRNGRD